MGASLDDIASPERDPWCSNQANRRDVTEMDTNSINDISHRSPAAGSHPGHSGEECTMNGVWYRNGDIEITDLPECSARPLAAFVQWCNDTLAGPDGYLSPRNSARAFSLAMQTVGTAGVSDRVIHAWIAALLANPIWGVIRYVKGAAGKAIRDIAELHCRAAAGESVRVDVWGAADSAARAVTPTLDPAGRYAVRAAYQSIGPVHSESGTTMDVVTGNAVLAHAQASESDTLALAGHAVQAWRRLAGMDSLAIPAAA